MLTCYESLGLFSFLLTSILQQLFVFQNAQDEPEIDSDSDNPNNFKIEQTKAEAEARSRGLQVFMLKPVL